MDTLGINAAFHDSAACLVRDGVVLAAAEEERFTRIKHAKRPLPFTAWELPFHAIDFCLAQANVQLADVDHIAYAFDPNSLTTGVPGSTFQFPTPAQLARTATAEGWHAWEGLFRGLIEHAPGQLADGAPHHLAARFRGVTAQGPYRWHFVKHHLAHAASAYLASPFAEAAVLTLDGRGERATTSFAHGINDDLVLLRHIDLPHSLGLLYEEVTAHLGFLRSSDEYKVMALASSGRPTYGAQFRDLLQTDRAGWYRVGELRLAERFGPPRQRGAPLESHHFDLAKSLQVAVEQTVLELVDWLHTETRAANLCLAGGVALNCVLNSTIRDRGPFRDVWVQPAAGDAGTALGAALWIDRQVSGRTARRWQMEHAYLGPAFADSEIEALLQWSKVPYRRLGDVARETAQRLAADQIVGWFQGAMEFGPRALGGRSILASPLSPAMQSRLNEIKDREDFRPVAPVVLEEHAREWFGVQTPAPFMLFVFQVPPDKADRIPAVRHVDGTARVQTIRRDQHPAYYELIQAFYEQTGVPVLVNTSFNTRGEPIVCSPRDALESFWTTPLDALVIGSFLVEKEARPCVLR